MSVLVRLVESIAQMPGIFSKVASHDPVAAVMLAVGSVLLAVTLITAGLLVLGGIAEFVTPSRRSPPRQPAQ